MTEREVSSERVSEEDTRQRFARWQNEGLALATEAGCEVSITGKSALSTWTLTNFEPSPAAPSEVTEEMVERACLGIVPNWYDCTPEVKTEVFQDMRAALTAALKGDR